MVATAAARTAADRDCARGWCGRSEHCDGELRGGRSRGTGGGRRWRRSRSAAARGAKGSGGRCEDRGGGARGGRWRRAALRTAAGMASDGQPQAWRATVRMGAAAAARTAPASRAVGRRRWHEARSTAAAMESGAALRTGVARSAKDIGGHGSSAGAGGRRDREKEKKREKVVFLM
ncbi:LOW QUALITY PROTEIN: hypothetical protein BRADI_3g34278v3 [Brachypodium distachyon]|uniref:Uncharacterized protein n=1 Tax=Brachypodium distachyon TaxID=15368 RepID=A0A2K2D112_BRADI|nr:LOW QUALITY PROTEIN: hypothetical protein BRADI_3g34278v3 [Brachypodium distachyon]